MVPWRRHTWLQTQQSLNGRLWDTCRRIIFFFADESGCLLTLVNVATSERDSRRTARVVPGCTLYTVVVLRVGAACVLWSLRSARVCSACVRRRRLCAPRIILYYTTAACGYREETPCRTEIMTIFVRDNDN